MPTQDTEKISSESENKEDHHEDATRNMSFTSRKEAQEYERKKANAILANPLRGYSHDQLRKMGKNYALDHALVEPEDFRAFEIGAVLAQNPQAWEKCEGLREEEKDILRREFASRWSQPWLLYLVIVLCSTCAAVQGMDETVVNGAQLFYSVQFGIGGSDQRSTWLLGLVNSAPYLGCSIVGCWLTIPFNNWYWRSTLLVPPVSPTDLSILGSDAVVLSSSPVSSQLWRASGRASSTPGGICLSQGSP